MLWFFGIFLLVCFAMLFIGGYLQKLTDREKVDSSFKKKMDKIRIRWDPKITFFENLIMWGFALVVIYYIYLGGSQ